MKPKYQDEVWGYLFIAPQFAGLLLFVIVPVVQSLGISFTQWNMLTPPVFAGLENYKKVLTDKDTLKAITNTLQYIIGFIPLTVIFSLLIALALSKKLKGHVLFRSLFYLPNITSSVAISVVWLWLFNPDFGLVNVTLGFFGIPPLGWYASIEWAMPTVILMSIWMAAGYYMIIFIAGLNSISDTYYEAASIDGAGRVYCFFKITLPLLTPTIFFVISMMLIGGFQIFNEVFMLTNGGPADATKTIVLEIYRTAFSFFRMGEAAVLSWILFAVVFIVTFLQFKFSKKWVNYDV
jgi:multiple sugar transport system permease protein